MAAGDERLARAERPVEEALRLHPFYRGKVQMLPKMPDQERSGLRQFRQDLDQSEHRT